MSPLLWFSIMAGTAPLVAATIPLYLFKNGINPRTFQTLLGLSAGLLFAIATLELIPEAFEMAELANSPANHKRGLFSDSLSSSFSTVETKLGTDGLVQNNDDIDDDDGHEHEGSGSKIAMLGLGAGYFFLVMLEQLMNGHGHSHSHSHSHTHTEEMEKGEEKPTTMPGLSASFSMVAFVGLAFHSLVDGLIIAGAFTASPETGSRVALAILLHKFPDGFVMSSIVASQHAKNPNTRRYLYIAAIAGMTPIGAMIGALLLGGIPPVAVSFVLGFGAGTFLYITATGILPELASGKGTDKLLSLVSVVVGYLAFLVIDTNMHAH